MYIFVTGFLFLQQYFDFQNMGGIVLYLLLHLLLHLKFVSLHVILHITYLRNIFETL